MIHWLGEELCHLDSLVGGKAASLSRLASLHTVPPGFAVAALPAAAHAGLDGLLELIGHAYDGLAARCGATQPAVAVRSSALDEDGSDAAFAGQHDTYLNVRGHAAVVDAVRRCVRSASSAEALAYRQRRGLSTDGVQMAVLVQELVPSEVSAVVFSANPISGSRDEVMINANWGLGESIVGGTATPDTFIVDKRSAEITLRGVATKRQMTVMAEDGTADVEVPEERSALPSLTDPQILEIARMASLLEHKVGHAVDVECAFARDTLFLLQCRPITTTLG